MPINYALYAANWKDIRKRVLTRANNRCEQCGVPNHAIIVRSSVDPEQYLFDCGPDGYFTPDGQLTDATDEYAGKSIKVVLTIAHLNHDINDNRMENLRAWCQMHHLRYDAQYHAENSRKTRAAKREQALKDAGQERLL